MLRTISVSSNPIKRARIYLRDFHRILYSDLKHEQTPRLDAITSMSIVRWQSFFVHFRFIMNRHNEHWIDYKYSSLNVPKHESRCNCRLLSDRPRGSLNWKIFISLMTTRVCVCVVNLIYKPREGKIVSLHVRWILRLKWLRSFTRINRQWEERKRFNRIR